MGKSSQRKGRGGEIELSKILRKYGYNVRPAEALNYGTIPDLIGLEGIHIECKRVEKLNLSKAMEQAVRDVKRFNDGAPTVFHRKNRGAWMVTMNLEDWIDLYERGCKADGRKAGKDQ